MYVVLEEINDDIACLIPDSNQDPLYVPIAALPEASQLGDVFIVKNKKNHPVSIELVNEEKMKRLEQNRLKREKLLKRSMKKNS